MVLTVDRNGELLSKGVVPEEAVEKNIFGEEIKTALIGIVAAGKYEKIELGPWESVKEAFLKTWEVIRLTCLTVVKLIQRVIPIKTVGGPILIGQMTGQLAKSSAIFAPAAS